MVCYLVAWELGKRYLGMLSGGMRARKGYLGMLSGGMGARKGIPWYVIWWHES